MFIDKFMKHKITLTFCLSVILITAVSLGLYRHNENEKKIQAESIRIAAQKKADKQKKEKIKKLKAEIKKREEQEKIKQLEKEKKEKQLADEKAKKKEQEEKKKQEEKAKEEAKIQQDKKSSESNDSKAVKESKTVSYSKSTNTAGSHSSSKSAGKGFKNPAFNGCSQVLLVKNAYRSSSTARVSCYEKINGIWQNVRGDMYSIIGQNGMRSSSTRRQNSNTTPAGIFNIIYMFGWGGNPGAKYMFKVPDEKSYWNLNDNSPTYNRWVEGNPGGDNEHLKSEHLYKYTIVLDYNYSQQKGKGGAIFIHLNPGHYTGGCIGLQESDLLYVMRWLDPGKNPKVVTCSQGELGQYYY